MNINIRTLSGGTDSKIDISDNVFAKKYNGPLIHQITTAYMAGSRQGSKSQKSRSEVSGGGSKPWKQKGTGRARAGTIRSPIFRKGGVTFAAKNRSYKQKINKKMYRIAICSILSELVKNKRLTVVDSFKLQSKKTKEFVAQIKPLKISNALIIVCSKEFSEELYLSSRNIKGINILNTSKINPVDLIRFNKVIFTICALKQIEERFL